MSTRTERDSLGDVEVPAHAEWGASTQRAVQNFPISGQPMPASFVRALGRVKRACADANHALGLLDDDVWGAIAASADEVAAGALSDHFPVDVYQTGSGTSTNMNANEVIARRASRRLGRAVHPNDHVNRSQSSNDVIPTTLHVAAAIALHEDLAPALDALAAALRERSSAFADVLKSGRTHLMDATPITLGQEVGAWASQAAAAAARARSARAALLPLALGGTAVGTGLNRPAAFPSVAIGALAEATGLPFVEARDHFAAQAAPDAVVEAHGQLTAVAATLTKIANDVRWLASGPRAGLGELILPSLQPGSSIMPGKTNPVLCEALVMVAARVHGNHATVSLCGASGAFQLNTTWPLLAAALLESIGLLAAAVRVFTTGCVVGLEADREVAAASVERNLTLVTAIAPAIGYDAAAAIAKEAHASGRTIRQVAAERGVLPPEELDRLLDPRAMTHPEDT